MAVVFNGCTPINTTEGTLKGLKYGIVGKDDGSNTFRVSLRGSRYDEWRADVKTTQEAIKFSLRVAALETKRRGFSYFALINTGANNLQGFPINRADDLSRYATLANTNEAYATRGRNGGLGGASRIPLRDSRGVVQLKIKAVEDTLKDSVFAVWSVEQTLKDTQ